MNLTDLSNEQLLSDPHALVGQGRKVLAGLLLYLGEVEQRRLDLQSACSSLFDFCVRRLGMGDDEACRRVAGARLVSRFPVALAMIERGEIHLTALLLLREHLTDDNHQELLRAVSGKTKSEVQHLLAERFARPDVPSRIQILPDAAGQGSVLGSAERLSATFATEELKSSRIEPLSPERYKVQFTAGAELKEKIERAANLMRHTNPRGTCRWFSIAHSTCCSQGSKDNVSAKRGIRRTGRPMESRRQGPAKAPNRATCRERCVARSSSGTVSNAPSSTTAGGAVHPVRSSSSITENHALWAAPMRSRISRSNAGRTTCFPQNAISGASTSNRRKTKGKSTRASAGTAVKSHFAHSAAWASRTAKLVARSPSSSSAGHTLNLRRWKQSFARRSPFWPDE